MNKALILFRLNAINIVGSKIDENRCKQTLASRRAGSLSLHLY